MSKIKMCSILLIAFAVSTGFIIDNAIVPQQEILSGGPPKDGIPAILNPKFITPDKAAYLDGDDQIIGVKIGNQAKAYPIRILNWHEVVNDTVGGEPVAVTF